MTIFFKRITLLTALFTIAPAHTKQMSKPGAAPRIQPIPVQPAIPIIPAPIRPIQPVQPAPVQPIIIQPQPAPARTNTWTSSAGLVYKSNKNLPNRINHVLAHAKADPTKKNHSVFNMPEYQILDVVDEAWNNRGNPASNHKGNSDEYIIDMERVIGTKGETKIQINTFQGTSEVVSAYPVQ